MVLKFELQACFRQQLVHFELVALRKSSGVVAVVGSHVVLQSGCPAEPMPQHGAAFDGAYKVLALPAAVALPSMLTDA